MGKQLKFENFFNKWQTKHKKLIKLPLAKASWLRNSRLMINKKILDSLKLQHFWSQQIILHPIKVKPKKSERFHSNLLLLRRSTMKKRRKETRNKKNLRKSEKKSTNATFKKFKQRFQLKKCATN